MSPVPTDQHQIESLKVVEQARFSAERVQQMFQESIGPALAFQESVQKSLDAQRPYFKALASQANELMKAFESIHRIQYGSAQKTIADTQEAIKSMLANMKPLGLEKLQLHKENPLVFLPSPSRTQSEVSEERIAELVFQKINAAAKSNGASLAPISKVAVLLPKGAHWEDLKIVFKNEFDLMVYLRGKHVGTYSHSILGFVKRSSKDKPDRQWDLLKLFAILGSNPGQMKPTIEDLARTLKISKDACTKAKESLVNKLQVAFGLVEDPFDGYDPVFGYKPKFQIESETILRNEEPFTHGRKIIDILLDNK